MLLDSSHSKLCLITTCSMFYYLVWVPPAGNLLQWSCSYPRKLPACPFQLILLFRTSTYVVILALCGGARPAPDHIGPKCHYGYIGRVMMLEIEPQPATLHTAITVSPLNRCLITLHSCRFAVENGQHWLLAMCWIASGSDVFFIQWALHRCVT